MSILTKEVIQKILNDDWLLMDDCEGLENCTVIKELARMALAAMDSEPVAYMTYKGYLLHAGDQKLAEYSEPMPLYADPRPASTPASPVAWDYEWASCITCEGPQNFNRVIEREAPPEWAVDEGQARNIIPLYRHAQPAKGLELAGWQFKSVNGDWLGLIDEHGKNQAVREGCEVREVFAMADGVNDRDQVRSEHAEWSQTTFGNVGPIGPLKHLSKEALEAAAEPGDLSEWADMQFLLWDAQRRAGITDEQITQAMIEKLTVNKQREWPEPKDGEPRLHIKELPAPVVMDDIKLRELFDSWFASDCSFDRSQEASEEDNIAWRESYWYVWQRCRAAMLQAGNSPVIPDGLIAAVNRLLDSDGSRGCYSAIQCGDAHDEIERLLAAAPHDTPALNSVQSVVTVPGKWIPVSERVPENDGAYLCWDKRYVTTYAFIFGAWQANQFIAKNITHWMPLPAGPQEVQGE